MKVEKDYRQIIQDIINTDLLMLKPMDVRRLLQLDTKTAYDLFNNDNDFPSIKISGSNYIIKERFLDWAKGKYLS